MIKSLFTSILKYIFLYSAITFLNIGEHSTLIANTITERSTDASPIRELISNKLDKNKNYIDRSKVIILNKTTHFSLSSAKQSSGFFIAPKEKSITDIALIRNMDLPKQKKRPDFKKNHSYWFYVYIYNTTKENNWVLHSSHFMIDEIKVVLIDHKASQYYKLNLSETKKIEKVNVLGPAIPINIETNTEYLLAVELSANSFVRPPYLGLIANDIYDHWSLKMDYAYKIAIGLILGLILIAIICSIAIKDITFIWFSLASIALLSLNISRSHISSEWLYKVNEHPTSLWFSVSLTALGTFLFFRSFLFGTSNQKKDYSNTLIISFNYAIAVSCCILVLTQFFSSTINILIFSIQGIILIYLCTYAGIQKALKEGNYYLIFILGWAPVFLTFLLDIYLLSYIPEPDENTLSYKNLLEPYIQIIHMLVHLFALLLRVIDLKRQGFESKAKNKARSDFLAAASHDLRQPLHSMKLFLSHINPYVKPGKGQELLSTIQNIHSSMSDSFTSLMDLSQLETASVNVRKNNIDLSLLFERLRIEYQEQARFAGLRLHVRVCNINIYSDPVLLERILRNLLSNAIKFTKKGGVLLVARRRQQYVLIQVWDTGIGIPERDHNRIFDIYQRSHETEYSAAGTGLGLTTAKHLCSLLNHKLNLKSQLSKGSVFEIRIPISDSERKNAYGIKTLDTKDNSIIEKGLKDTPKSHALCIYIDINDQKLAKEVIDYLDYWGYTALTEQNSHISAQTQIVLIDDITEKTIITMIKEGQLTHNHIHAIIHFTNTPEAYTKTELAPDIKIKTKAYRLNSTLKPAKLRSLLKHIEKQIN